MVTEAWPLRHGHWERHTCAAHCTDGVHANCCVEGKHHTALHCIYLFTVCGLVPHRTEMQRAHAHMGSATVRLTTTYILLPSVRRATSDVRPAPSEGADVAACDPTHPHSIGLANPILATPNPLYEYTLTGGHDGSRALGEAAELRRLREPVGAALHRSAALVRRGRTRVQLPGHLALVLVRVRG